MLKKFDNNKKNFSLSELRSFAENLTESLEHLTDSFAAIQDKFEDLKETIGCLPTDDTTESDDDDVVAEPPVDDVDYTDEDGVATGEGEEETYEPPVVDEPADVEAEGDDAAAVEDEDDEEVAEPEPEVPETDNVEDDDTDAEPATFSEVGKVSKAAEAHYNAMKDFFAKQ